MVLPPYVHFEALPGGKRFSFKHPLQELANRFNLYPHFGSLDPRRSEAPVFRSSSVSARPWEMRRVLILQWCIHHSNRARS